MRLNHAVTKKLQGAVFPFSYFKFPLLRLIKVFLSTFTPYFGGNLYFYEKDVAQ